MHGLTRWPPLTTDPPGSRRWVWARLMVVLSRDCGSVTSPTASDPLTLFGLARCDGDDPTRTNGEARRRPIRAATVDWHGRLGSADARDRGILAEERSGDDPLADRGVADVTIP